MQWIINQINRIVEINHSIELIQFPELNELK